MTRILIVTETGDAWPSGYVRAILYGDRFRAAGLDVRYETRREPSLTRLAERPPRALVPVLARGGQRLLDRLASHRAERREAAILEAAREREVIYLQKTSSWPLFAALRDLPGKRIVYDLNDSVWLPRWAGFASGRVREILGAADAVTCDNPHTLAFAREVNPRVHLVPDPAQVEDFDRVRASAPRTEGPAVLGWIGSPGTVYNLFSIFEPLERLFARLPGITLRLLGVGPDRSRLPPFEKVRFDAVGDYTRDDMIREALGMDIGLYPLFDIEDSRSRGILKAAIYMSGEAAVVCPPIGHCADLIEDGVNGAIASSAHEWESKLERLVREPDLRRRLAAAGLKTVRERFSIDRCFASLRAALLGEETSGEGPA
jgi:glycosyltransferase involved in cell wall biosynthesis